MDLSHYTLWELIKLNQQIQLACLIKIWWVFPVVAILIGIYILYLHKK